MQIAIKILDNDIPIPSYAHLGDAGCDLYSRVDTTLKPGERMLIPTGIAISIPQGYAGFVQPRSGLAVKHGLGIVNSPGLIDSHYRGEIGVIMINLDPHEDFEIEKGQKIAQLVIQKVESVEFLAIDKRDATERGEGGFGSTG